MIEGYEYLIHQQNEDGTWDNTEESDAYTSYHAIMVACQAMIVPQYKGYGPAMEGVLPLLNQWYTEEVFCVLLWMKSSLFVIKPLPCPFHWHIRMNISILFPIGGRTSDTSNSRRFIRKFIII